MFLIPGAKLAQKVDVNTALYNVIVSTRGEEPASKTIPACRAFQQLRAALHEPPTTEATRRAIKRYLTAFNYVINENKVPSVLPIKLLWFNAFDATDHCVVSDINIDHISSLFNLAVCEATLASVAYRQRRTDPEAMKRTARHFQMAAGYFRAASQLPTPGGMRNVTCDLYPLSLNALEMVMLGNAQKVLYEITLEGGTAPAILARFAVGARDFYQIAEESCREPDVVNTCINGYVGRPAAALAAYFDVVAQSAQAAASRDAHDMPQQLARLEKAQKSLNVGLKTIHVLDTSSLASVAALRDTLLEELNTLGTRIATRKEEAEDENRTVYFTVPASKVPEIVSRQSVKPASVENVMSEELLDHRLLPFGGLPEPLSEDASGIVAQYSDMASKEVAEQAALLSTSASHLREAMMQVEEAVSSQRRAALDESSKPEPTESSTLEEEQKAIDAIQFSHDRGGLSSLRELQSQVNSMAGEAKSMVQSTESLLYAEDAEDRQLRARIQVSRPKSADLTQPYWTKLAKIKNNLEQAANADLIVGGQIDGHTAAISALDGIKVLDFIAPSAMTTTSKEPQTLARVDAIAIDAEVHVAAAKEQLERKDSIVQDFEKKRHMESALKITSTISEKGAEVEQVSAIIEREYGELREQSRTACSEMKRIADNLKEAVARLREPTRGDDTLGEARRRMNDIYKNQAAALKFIELVGHLEQGADFYAKEQDNVVMLKTDIEGYVTARRTEAVEMGNAQSLNTGMGQSQQGFYPSTGNTGNQQSGAAANGTYSHTEGPSIWRRR